MSDFWFIFVSADPRWTPTGREAVEASKSILEAAFPGGEVVAEQRDSTQFVDCGDMLEDVTCPHCSCSAMEWWSDAMSDTFADSGFENLSVVTPCCQKSVGLDELVYDKPCAFAQFEISVRNPGTGEVPAHVRGDLEATLHTDLTLVARHI